MNPYTEALAELAAIEKLVERSPGGYPAPELVQLVRRHLQNIRWSGAKGGVGMKLASIEGNIEILYSVRKHERYARGASTGAEVVRGMLMNDLSVLRSILHEGEQRTTGEAL